MARATRITWVACLLWAMVGVRVGAQPTIEQMLSFSPIQKDVVVSTPSAADTKTCEVKVVQGSRAGSGGYLLVDAKKQPLRRFLDSDGDKKVDTWSYYKEGVEVFREIASNGSKKANQFRWLNSAGSKWGVDADGDGKIDDWRLISAEEVGQEAFLAVATRDFARLKALLITEAEMQGLKLSSAQTQRIAELHRDAPKKFSELTKTLASLDKATFVRVEGSHPQCVPGETYGAEGDIIRFSSKAILYESAEKKHDWLHTGELVLVGAAWRLIDVPSTVEDPGVMREQGPSNGNPKLQEILTKLAKVDEEFQAAQPGTKEGRAALEKRLALLQEILQTVDGKEREAWYKQLFDNLTTAGQAGDDDALKNLTNLRDQVVKSMPGTNLAGYVTYREMWAKYARSLSSPNATQKDLTKLQESWLDQLAKFVQSFPKAEDTPDALSQLGLGCEFSGKEDEAKRWYNQVYTAFPEHPLAARAKGAERRLGIVGQAMELTGPQLGSGSPYDLTQAKGKVAIVYYWASNWKQSIADFAVLKKVHADHHVKGLEIVTVSLDDNGDEAKKFLETSPLTGTHLFQASMSKAAASLNSPLADQYGINGPTLFVVGRDGRVVQRSIQASELDDVIRKMNQ